MMVPSGGTFPPPLVPLLWLEKIDGSACPTEVADAKGAAAGDHEDPEPFTHEGHDRLGGALRCALMLPVVAVRRGCEARIASQCKDRQGCGAGWGCVVSGCRHLEAPIAYNAWGHLLVRRAGVILAAKRRAAGVHLDAWGRVSEGAVPSPP